MSPLFMTIIAWIGLVASLYWLGRTVLKVRSDKRPGFVVGHILSPATTILIALSFLVVEDLSLRIALVFVASVLGLLGTILQNRFPSR
jgi:amino acid permease